VGEFPGAQPAGLGFGSAGFPVDLLGGAAAAMRRFTRRGDSPLRAEAAGALAGLIALMTHGLVDISVWGTRGGFVPWAVMGLAAALYSVAQTSSVSGDAEPRSFTST